jgi:hypothetical protein
LGVVAPSDSEYRNSNVGASFSYRVSEQLTGSLSASRATYQPGSGNGKTLSDSVNLGTNFVLSETANLTAGLGLYQSQRSVVLTGTACPLASEFCDAGLVARVPVSLGFDAITRGNQFNFSYGASLDERSALNVSLQRQLSPGATGVNQSDNLTLGLSRTFTPTFNVNGTAMASQSTQTGVTPVSRATLYTATLACGWTLSEKFSLSAGATLRRFEGGYSIQGAHSASISISLQYQGPKIRTSH